MTEKPYAAPETAIVTVDHLDKAHVLWTHDEGIGLGIASRRILVISGDQSTDRFTIS